MTAVASLSRTLILATALASMPLIAPVAGAQEAGQDGSTTDAGQDGSTIDAGQDGSTDAGQDTSTIDEQRLLQELVNEITRRVVDELRSGDFLQEQIRLGIEAYVRDQEAAQAAARAEQARLASERVRDVRPPERERDHIYGDPDAPISLIAYSDFECPFCKQFHTTPKVLVDAYPGQVNWVYRHLPLPMHNPGAERQAEASECAAAQGGNDAFWAYADAIYERTESNGNGFPLADLIPLAAEIGLDETAFEACLNEGRYAGRVVDDVAEAVQLGVNSTPTVIVRQNRTGEVRLRSGALPMDVYTADIEALRTAPD